MKEYHWCFSKKALKELKRMDQQVSRRIVQWLNTHISGTSDPRKWGKALEGNLGTFWRYRVGKYRIIAEIQDNNFIVEVIKVNKRNDVYLKK